MGSAFARQMENHGSAVAVREADGKRWSYTALARYADAFAERLGPAGSVTLILCRNALPTLAAYLACLRHGRVAMLADAALKPAYLQELIEAYRPSRIVAANGEVAPGHPSAVRARGDLQLLLSTSGSTGTPKQVMLSADNVQANARSICDYLPIMPDDRAVTCLPFHYSYGLSIVNTHLLAGASLTLTDSALVSREFWELFERDRITSLAGVPFVYETLERLKFERMALPHLRYLTQAGGRLPPERVVQFAQEVQRRGIPFYVMYGQTEATARIAYLPPEQAAVHPDSIGVAIPGGRLLLRDVNTGKTIAEEGQAGELVYRGPNVMLGYALGYQDLTGDNRLEELATGDLAQRDENGLYYIVGRLKRFIKLFGHRVNLDELERRMAAAGFDVLCTGADDRLVVGNLGPGAATNLTDWLLSETGIHPRCVRVVGLSGRPLTASGKVCYEALLKEAM